MLSACPTSDGNDRALKGRCIVIAFLLFCLLIALGSLAILGWTADSRDDEQKLWPLDRRHLDIPTTASTRHGRSVGDARPDALTRPCAIYPAGELLDHHGATRERRGQYNSRIDAAVPSEGLRGLTDMPTGRVCRPPY